MIRECYEKQKKPDANGREVRRDSKSFLNDKVNSSVVSLWRADFYLFKAIDQILHNFDDRKEPFPISSK